MDSGEKLYVVHYEVTTQWVNWSSYYTVMLWSIGVDLKVNHLKAYLKLAESEMSRQPKARQYRKT